MASNEDGYSTQQERLWASAHTEAYIQRSSSPMLLAAKTALYAEILAHVRDVKSVVEFGPNIGLNLEAIRLLLPDVSQSAVEISPAAAEVLRNKGNVEVFEDSLLNFRPAKTWDLAFTMGVLIHVSPERLREAYDLLYRASNRYVLMIEYYNPSPIMIMHRGLPDQMFKRDFAREMLEAHPDLNLLKYGFVYHRDPVFPLDDVTWFLFEQPADHR
ncbi:MAG: pseudaminic acid biosynthesis-associated methylase [Vicinamibacterales bacterium]